MNTFDQIRSELKHIRWCIQEFYRAKDTGADPEKLIAAITLTTIEINKLLEVAENNER